MLPNLMLMRAADPALLAPLRGDRGRPGISPALRHCVAIAVAAAAAQESVERLRSEPQGIVRMSCPVALLHYQVADMIAKFMLACPRVKVQIEATNRRVDVIAEGPRYRAAGPLFALGGLGSRHEGTGRERSAASRQPRLVRACCAGRSPCRSASAADPELGHGA